MSDPNWKDFVDTLKSTRFIIRLGKLADLVQGLAGGYLLTLKDKQFILESHRSQYDEQGNVVCKLTEEGESSSRAFSNADLYKQKLMMKSEKQHLETQMQIDSK